MSEQEPPRIVALKSAVEFCLKGGLSESEVIRLVQAEVSGAEMLRKAIYECMAPDKVVRMSFYEQKVDKKVTNEDIFVAVNQVVQGTVESR